MLKFFFAIISIASASICKAQYVSHATLRVTHSADTLTDGFSSTKFIVDTSRIFVTALDGNGKLLWRTDPWKNNNLPAYRVKRPLIVDFYFAKNEWTESKEVIWIIYNNTQFGIIDKKTGNFKWFGQD